MGESSPKYLPFGKSGLNVCTFRSSGSRSPLMTFARSATRGRSGTLSNVYPVSEATDHAEDVTVGRVRVKVAELVEELEIPVPTARFAEEAGAQRVPQLAAHRVGEDGVLVQVPDVINVEPER